MNGIIFLCLIARIDQYINEKAIGGPNIWYCKASLKFPFKLADTDLVRKHVGHGNPVECLIGQLHPGSQFKYLLSERYPTKNIGMNCLLLKKTNLILLLYERLFKVKI